jgi:cation diffusion facilitator CzcD-associated flavoprotein CzcO
MSITDPSRARSAATEPDHHVVIIGAGFGGIGAAVELERAGIDDYVILEKWDGPGGTWRANRYPGVAVDIPSLGYSFSYEQRADWSRVFAPGEDLLAYAEDVVDRRDLRRRMRFHTTVEEMTFDETADVWHLSIVDADGARDISARYVINAVGALERPVYPDIDGIDRFKGTILHTARWDDSVDLAGKRVACIGTGASALQVIPEIAGDVAHLDVYQRTPIWVAPKADTELGMLSRAVLSVPPVRNAVRGAATVFFDVTANVVFQQRLKPVRTGLETALRAWMRSQVDDPQTREALIPDYGFGCKRPSMSNTYLKTFNQDNVDLITTPIRSIAPTGVRTDDGVLHKADVLICATGFHVMGEQEPVPFPIHGRNGVELGKFWLENRFHAYQGVSVCGFPNLFSVMGPYGFVVGSYFWMIESTTRHAVRVITEAERRGATSAEIRKGPQDRFVRRCRERQAASPLFGPTCATSNTYYVNFQGDSPLRPSLYAEMWWDNRHFPLTHYRYATPVREPAAGSSGRHRALTGA